MPKNLKNAKEAIKTGQAIHKALYERLPGFHIEGTWVSNMPCYNLSLYVQNESDDDDDYVTRKKIEIDLFIESGCSITHWIQDLDPSEIPSKVEMELHDIERQKSSGSDHITYSCIVDKLSVDEIIDFFVMLTNKS